MKTALDLIKRWWWAGLLLLLLLVTAGYFIAKLYAPKPVPANDQPYSAITPGKTTSTQLNAQIGKPYTNYDDGGYTVKTQQSNKSPYQPDRFYIKDGVVVMKEQWFEPTVYYYAAKDAEASYGQPTKTLYDLGPSDVTLKALLYPGRGLAVYVIEESQAVRKIQYFAPMSIDDYLKTWGTNLGEKKDIKPFALEPSNN